jgi:hypothetical protein
VLAIASVSCAPDIKPDLAGPPFVAGVMAYDPMYAATYQYLYLTTRASECDKIDLDGGGGPQPSEVPVGWAFRTFVTDLVQNPDQVEMLGDDGLGDKLYDGIVEITNPDGSPVVSPLDPAINLGPENLVSVYQPGGGSGCKGTPFTFDYEYVTPNPGPAFITMPNLPLPSGSTLTLWLHPSVPGHEIRDYGGNPLADGDLGVEFNTAPMTVDCASADACNVVPFPDPTAEADLGTMGFVQVGFTAPVGDPSGVSLYDDTGTLVPDLTAIVDSTYADSETASDVTVDLIAGTEAAPEPLVLADGATYTIVVTDAVTDWWAVPAQAIPDDTSCVDLAAFFPATVTNCIWAGQFTMPVPAP